MSEFHSLSVPTLGGPVTVLVHAGVGSAGRGRQVPVAVLRAVSDLIVAVAY